MVADLFHYGHVNFLRQASGYGDTLLVGIHADEAITYKAKPILTMEERVRSVEGCKYVDEVIPNAPIEIDREWIEKHDIELILHGDDFTPELEALCYAVPIELGIFQRIPYTEGISTTELVSRVIAARGRIRD